MKILGIDWGSSHLGLAIGDDQTRLADPLGEIKAADAIKSINQICADQGIKKIVVGISENKSAQKTHQFISQLEALGLPIALADETLTSQDAQSHLGHLSARKRDRRQHAAAAAILLELWLADRV